MNRAGNHNERIRTMTFASVYPHYVAKIEKEDRKEGANQSRAASGHYLADGLRRVRDTQTHPGKLDLLDFTLPRQR